MASSFISSDSHTIGSLLKVFMALSLIKVAHDYAALPRILFFPHFISISLHFEFEGSVTADRRRHLQMVVMPHFPRFI